MCTAFEITTDDVEIVLRRMGRTDDPDEIFDQLDCGAIEKAALYGDDMDEQTRYAYEEIETQIKEL